MYPVAVIGAVGIALAVSTAWSRRDRTTWALLSLALCLLVGMVGASFSMRWVLDYIAAGPEGHEFWLPLTFASVKLLPR
jgi:hypothetical protein